MNTKSIKSFAALLLLGSSISATINPAKADLFCYRWESNCKADGHVGTSGNDILGLAGGDTLEKIGHVGMAATAGASGGSVTLPVVGTVTGGVGGAILGTVGTMGHGLYQTIKRERNASIAAEQPKANPASQTSTELSIPDTQLRLRSDYTKEYSF